MSTEFTCQDVAQGPHNPPVVGSSPTWVTVFAQVEDAGPVGRPAGAEAVAAMSVAVGHAIVRVTDRADVAASAARHPCTVEAVDADVGAGVGGGARDTSRRTQRERMLAGEPRRRGTTDSELSELFLRARRLIEAYNRTPAEDAVELRRILTALLGSVGEGVEIRQPFFVDFGAHISVGARTFANSGLTALDVARITIGEDVQLGPNVQLLTPSHPVDPRERREGWETGSPITIGDNVWLGGGVIVVPGVTIGSDTVIGAGAVVTKDIPPGSLAVGNPARVIRELEAG